MTSPLFSGKAQGKLEPLFVDSSKKGGHSLGAGRGGGGEEGLKFDQFNVPCFFAWPLSALAGLGHFGLSKPLGSVSVKRHPTSSLHLNPSWPWGNTGRQNEISHHAALPLPWGGVWGRQSSDPKGSTRERILPGLWGTHQQRKRSP